MVIIGGGPGGYEAALVARQLGGEVTLVEDAGLGGSAVLTDVVPSKTLIAAAEVMTTIRRAEELGLGLRSSGVSLGEAVGVDLGRVNARIRSLALAQSADIAARLRAEGVRLIAGRGRLDGTHGVVATTAEGEERLTADIILIATGAYPRELPSAQPDAERILTDVQLLESDAGDLDLERWAAERAPEKIAVPDTEYDSEFWRDVDDEGVGGQGRY